MLRVMRARSSRETQGLRHEAPSAPARAAATLVDERAQLVAQPKLEVGAPGDRFEQEADRVAERVMQTPWSPVAPPDGQAPRIAPALAAPRVQAKCAGCANEDEKLRGKPVASSLRWSPGLGEEIRRVRGGGAPLPRTSRAFFEARFGADFGAVRVHADAAAARSAQALGARAYTIGRDIVFAPGQFQPGTREGQQLLAHELTHTIQQGAASGSAPLRVGAADGPAEHEADRAGRAAVENRAMPPISAAAAPSLQRAPNAGGTSGIHHQMAERYRRAHGIPSGTGPSDAAIIHSEDYADWITYGEVSKKPRSLLTARRHGPDPSLVLKPFIADLAKPNAAALADPPARAAQVVAELVAALDHSGPAANARMTGDILENTEKELADALATINADWQKLKAPTTADRRSYLERLHDFCVLKQREVQLEFKYDVVFINPRGEPAWSYSLDYWNKIDATLAEIPEEHLWNRSFGPITMRREAGDPNKSTGGQTVRGEGAITIFDKGASDSMSLDSVLEPAYRDTLSHEMGHVVDNMENPGLVDVFFKSVVDWREYNWWVAKNCANTGVDDERCVVCHDAGLMKNNKCDNAALTALMGRLEDGQKAETLPNGRTFRRSPKYEQNLNSWPDGNVPKVSPQFNYARTAKTDYFAEIYKYALVAPEKLHGWLPAAQIDWLKKNIFNTEIHLQEALKELTVDTATKKDFSAALSAQAPQATAKLFTKQQIVRALARLRSQLTSASTAEGALA